MESLNTFLINLKEHKEEFSQFYNFIETQMYKINKINKNDNPILEFRFIPEKGLNYEENKKYIQIEHLELSNLGDKGLKTLYNYWIKAFNDKKALCVSLNYSATLPEKGKAFTKDNIIKLSFIPLDLDIKFKVQEYEGEADLISKKLEEELLRLGLTYSYKAEGRGGFHYLLPFNLDNHKEISLKIETLFNLLNTTLQKEFKKDKPFIDFALKDVSRVLRCGGVYNFKEGGQVLNKVLDNNSLIKDDIEKNSKILNELEIKTTPNEGDFLRNKSLDKDTFYTTILKNPDKWEQYKQELNKAQGSRSVFFVKNLSSFVRINKEFLETAKSFLGFCDKDLLKDFDGWNRSPEHFKVVYTDLYKWAEDNNLTLFSDLLQKDIKNESFFTKNFESYFLVEEVKDKQFILYDLLSNETLQTNIETIANKIWFLAMENKINLAHFFNLDCSEDWDKLKPSRQLKQTMEELKSYIFRNSKAVNNIIYIPGENKIYSENNKEYLNIWQPAPIDLWIPEIKEVYSFPYIKELILNICTKDENKFNHLMNYLSCITQNPKEKLPTSFLFWGEPGAGKNVFENHVMRRTFKDVVEINQTQIEGVYNSYMIGSRFIFANEIITNDNKNNVPGILKSYTADEYISLREMFKNPRMNFKNVSHWFFCSNSDKPLVIDTKDRRYTVYGSETLKGSHEKAREWVSKNLLPNLDNELKEFWSFLKTYKVNKTKAGLVYDTEEKKKLQDISKSSINHFMEYLSTHNEIEDLIRDLGTLKIREIYGYDLSNQAIYNEVRPTHEGKECLTFESIYRLYLEYCNKYNIKHTYGMVQFSQVLENTYQIKFSEKVKWVYFTNTIKKEGEKNPSIEIRKQQKKIIYYDEFKTIALSKLEEPTFKDTQVLDLSQQPFKDTDKDKRSKDTQESINSPRIAPQLTEEELNNTVNKEQNKEEI